jgi:DNA-directed RNA polymerase subunit RPC12/RpoP
MEQLYSCDRCGKKENELTFLPGEGDEDEGEYLCAECTAKVYIMIYEVMQSIKKN